jgi:hypothetical protein
VTDEPRRAAIETYRYLRVGIVALAVLLMLSVLNQVISDGQLLGSISAYYYTPARDVFVGILFALGLGLVVIRGRGVEDVLLNLAGMLAPVVAVVPTTAASGWFAYAPLAGGPAPYLDVGPVGTNAIWSLIALGVLGVSFAGITAVRRTGVVRARAVRGVLAGGIGVLAFAGWLTVDEDSFFAAAHYVAAAGMLGLFVVVARFNAASARDTDAPVVAMLPARRRRAAYSAISWSMLGTVVVAGLLGLLQLAGSIPIPHWLFWAEAIVLTLFAAFWVLQTIEYWRDGVPLDSGPAG